MVRVRFVTSLHLLVFAAMVSLCSAAAAQEGPEITLKYFEQTKGRLAFVYRKQNVSDIWVIDFSTLVVQPIVRTPGEDTAPSWSPDGQTLAFDSEIAGDREIFTVKADGTHLTRLTNTPGEDRDPDWSPDGTQIVFASSRNNGGTSLFIMKPDGTGAAALPIQKRKGSAKNILPKWSPRGTEILYSTNEDWPGWDIALYDTASKSSKLLTTGYRSFSRGAWHPSGGSFIFCYGTTEEIDLWGFKKGAPEMAPVIKRPGKDLDAVWTDDGQRFFFAAEPEANRGSFQLFIWDGTQGKVLPVASGPGSFLHPAWTPLPLRPPAEAEPSEHEKKQP